MLPKISNMTFNNSSRVDIESENAVKKSIIGPQNLNP